MEGITKNLQKKKEGNYIYKNYIKMTVRMILIMPHMDYWMLKMTIKTRNKMLIYMNKFMVQISLMNGLVQVKTFISKKQIKKNIH